MNKGSDLKRFNKKLIKLIDNPNYRKYLDFMERENEQKRIVFRFEQLQRIKQQESIQKLKNK